MSNELDIPYAYVIKRAVEKGKRIAELEAEVTRLRAALRPFAEHARRVGELHADTMVAVRFGLFIDADRALRPTQATAPGPDTAPGDAPGTGRSGDGEGASD